MFHHKMPTRNLSRVILVLGGSLFLWLPCLSSLGDAQVPPITPSGLNTQISGPIAIGGKTQFNITGGTRPGGGANLFHSFGEFGVPTNNVANFFNDSGLATSNILGRVTGGNISNIFGTIQTTGFGNANLFLLNPAGFLFGPNATVNVGGMVVFTSADYLKLTDGTKFNAIPNATADALLSASPVAAFGFLGSNPGSITIQGAQITVTQGTGISLIGGNITIESGMLEDSTVQPARLSAPGGQINLASVASPGEILSSNLQTAPNVNGQSISNMGTISISQNSLLDVSSDAAGSVRIRGGQLVVDNATISADTGNVDGAPIAIDINVTDAVSLSNTNIPALTARTSGAGNAGNIVISSGSMNASFGADTFPASLIDSHTMGSGHGGDVTLTTGPLTMNGNPSAPGYFIDSGTGGEGNGGNVSITASDARIRSGGINTGDNTFFGSGNGGNLTIKSNSLVLGQISFATDSFNARAGALSLDIAGLLSITGNSFISNVSLLGENPTTIKADRFVMDNMSAFLSGTALANGGDFAVTARVVDFSNGGVIATQTFGDGRAGNIHIIASERVSLINSPNDPTRPSGLFTQSLGDSALGTHGDAGSITIDTPRLELTNGARINSTTLTSGQGGDVTITQANSVSITGERSTEVFEEMFALGGTRASGIYTKTLGSDLCSGSCGSAGNINITTGSLTLQNGGLIDSGTTNNGQGGSVTVSGTSQVLISGTMIDGTPSGIFSRSNGTDLGAGSGGNILLKANSVMIQGGAQLSANSLGPGTAGSVTVEGTSSQAQSVLIDGNDSGLFTTTSDTGAGGNIFVNANSVTLQNGGTLSAATSGTAASATGGTITVNANQVQLNNGGLITASTTGAGPGGSITIRADGTFASNASTVSNTATQAQGGDITITAGQSMTLNNGSLITASSSGAGNAGNILINAGQNYTSTDSAVTTQATQASGGNITVLATDMIQLTNSQLNASVQGSSTTIGGNITIDPQYVILLNSQILAQATQGQGGAISINITNGGLFLPDATSTVSASSQFGVNGSVTIQSPNAPASGKIQPLGKSPLLATTLLNQRCAVLAGGEFSSFTVAGREQLPADPRGWLTSPLAFASLNESLVTGDAVGSIPTITAMPTHDDGTVSLRRFTPAGFLIANYADSEATGCHS